MSATLERELLDAGIALGLLDASGGLDASWFGHPDQRIQTILSNSTQRGAVLDLLDQIAPPASIPGLPAGEKWHPLLADKPNGNLYLTVNDSGGKVVVGIAGDLHGATPASAALRARLPVVSFSGNSVNEVAGKKEGPLAVTVRVPLNWTHGPGSIGLKAVQAEIDLAPIDSQYNFTLMLEGLSLDGSAAKDVPLDPANLGAEATHVLVGLIHQTLLTAAGGSTEAQNTVQHLMPLFGLGSDGIPTFPFADLLTGPAILQTWLNAILSSGKLNAWLGHLASLFGVAAPVIAGSGTLADPWRVQIAASPELDLTVAHASQKLLLGLRFVLNATGGGAPDASVEANALIAGIPLSGTGAAPVLPSASLVVRSPGGAGKLAAAGPFTADAIRGGVTWNGTALSPVLEMVNVTLQGTHYDRIDLTNTDSVAAAAAAFVETQIQNAIGNNPTANHLLALAGLKPPALDPAWPAINIAKLVANPTGAIADVHRAGLTGGAHNWGSMLAELGGLLSLAGPVTGSGTQADPWVLPLAPIAGPLKLELAGWNAAASGDPQLRIGLRLAAGGSPWSAQWLAELLAFDLPAAGNGNVLLLGGQHASFGLAPVPTTPPFAGMTMSADSIGIQLDWTPGSPLAMYGLISNITINEGTPPVQTVIGSLRYPSPGPAPTDIPSFATSIGLTPETLETLLRILFARAAYSWADMSGLAATVLLGIHGNVAGLQTDWPTIDNAATPGAFFNDPLAALRDWLSRVTVNVSSDGSPFLPPTLDWLRALLGDTLPDLPTETPMEGQPVDGNGVYDDPWRIGVAGADAAPVELLAWLEPAGPPPAWIANLAARITAAGGYSDAFDAAAPLARHSAAFREALTGTNLGLIEDGLSTLDAYFATSDGVAPFANQTPAGWAKGTALTCAHHKQPSDPSAISQILAQIAAWAPAQRAVLLLGPAFSDHSIWDALLTAAGQAPATSAASIFNLRVPGLDPASIDLSPIATVADYYRADLQDNGSIGNTDNLKAQIARVVSRIQTLRPGVNVIIVAHSTAGIPARAFTAGSPAGVTGLITLGTPHGGATLDPLLDSGAADALRFLQRATPSLPAGPVADAVGHLLQALDGSLPPASGQLPVPWPYPYGSFSDSGDLSHGAANVLALGGTLGGSLFSAVRGALAAQASAAAGAAVTAPTHLAFGVQGRLDMPIPGAGDVAVDAVIRADAFRVALKAGAPEPARLKNALTVTASLVDPTGWLVGGSNSFVDIGAGLADVRVRWAELGATIVPNAGSIAVTPFARLHQAAFHGPTAGLVQLPDLTAQSLLGALLDALNKPGLLPGSPVDVLLKALSALGLAVPNQYGVIGLSADAFTAIQVDPAGYMAPRLLTALAAPDGFLGLSGPAAGPWVMTIGDGPLEIYIFYTNDWEIGLRVAPNETLTFGSAASLAFDARMHVPALTCDLDLSFSVAATTLSYSSGGQVTISAEPWLDPLPLPPTPAALKTALVNAVPRILLSSAVTSFVEGVLGPVFKIAPIDKLLGAPGKTLGGSDSMGNGNGFDSAKINQLLSMIGTAIGSPSPSGLALPAGLLLSAAGTDPVTISLKTTTDIGGVLKFELDASIDSLHHAEPGGTLTLTLPLPGTWGTAAIAFGIGANGVTLSVAPTGIAPIQLLPTFSGLGSLSGAAAGLLPQALDALNGATAASPFKTTLINIATQLQLFNATFAAQTANWKLLLQGGYLSSIANRAGLLDAVKTVLATDLQLPGTVTHAAGSPLLTYSVPAGSGALGFSFGWDAHGPLFTAGATNLKFANGPLTLRAHAGIAGDLTLTADLGVAFNLKPAAGIPVTPLFLASYNGTGFKADFYPLGDETTKLDIALLPTPKVNAQAGALDDFILKWLVPVVGNMLVKAESASLSKPAWPGSSLTIQNLIDQSGVLGGTKTLTQMVTGLAGAVLSNADIPIGAMHLGFVKDSGGFGVKFWGHEDIPAGSIDVSLRFGEPMSSPPFFTKGGITFYLFDSTFTNFTPKLSVKGLGIGFTGQNGPLINTSFLRTGRMGGYMFFDVDLKAVNVTNFGAGIEIDQFGIPLGQALGGNAGGNNPVAAGMLQSGGGAGQGDTHPVNPAVDLWASYIGGSFEIEIQNQTGAIWIGLHQQFGPIYIDQVGLEIRNNTDAALLVDGGVQVSGFQVQVDELGVVIPLKSLASPDKWSLDLRGLAASYNSGGVSIAGGLLKVPGPPVEYDGMLKIEIAGKGFTAVGAYSQPKDGNDTYTSFFIFVALPITLGGPPFFFVTGLGGGAGINRRLLVPSDITQIPNFLLVSAIDDSSFANDPMGALQKIAGNIPSRRGSYWFAAGIRFDTFVLIHSVAVVYVALDKGFEIGILGVSRMALPTSDVAIVSVELALKMRFSTAEGILSIQAQLTDNSYLFSKSCQLTGGFAFFTWFPEGQFVLTVGGYHPAFQKPAQFPDVPRLGFHWSVSDAIVVKGEAYFALTNSCVMAGGRLEASAHLGPLSAWFIAYADFLISWDPFHYDIAIGVEVGVALDFDVCFIVCGHVHLEVSLGADLHIIGPPLHGEVTVHVLFFSATIPFGPDPNPKPNYIQEFSKFSAKYLSAGDPNSKVVGVRVTGGLLPPDPPGAKPNPGTKTQPWQLTAEFSFATETRMPASSFATFIAGVGGPVAGIDIDLAAMDVLSVTSQHIVTIFKGDTNVQPTTDAAHFVIQTVPGFFPEATWRWTDPEKIKAAARKITAVSGMTIQGIAVPVGQSALIPISTLVDDIPQYAKPLPFVTVPIVQITAWGMAAEALAAAVAGAPSVKMLDAATAVLTGGGTLFAQARQQLSLPAQGLSPLAKRSLRRTRSAPPLVAPLTTGMTMKAPGLPPPPAIKTVPQTGPVILKQPRLRSVLQKRAHPVSDAPAPIRTTVLQVKEAANAPRMLAPEIFAVAGARLHVIPAAKARRPTRAAIAPRGLHHPDTGILLGTAHKTAFDKAAGLLVGDGVVAPSGTTHVWDLPAGGSYAFAITGNAAVRVVALDRASRVLLDHEMMPQQQPVAIPREAVMVAIQCLGIPPAKFAAPAPAFGAITIALAPAGAFPAVGWQSGNEFEQLGALALLGRGSSFRMSRSSAASHQNQKTTQAMVRVSQATLGMDAVETRLPSSAEVVMILLDGQDPSAAIGGDLSIAVDGATLVTPPIPIGGGRRRALLYNVRRGRAEFFTVSAGSKNGWQVSGIAGLHGTAIEWANRMHGDVPEHVIPEGPLTPDGQVRVRLVTALTVPVTGPVGTVTPVTPPATNVRSLQ